MKILIDADGCPVVDIALRLAKEHNIKAVIFCDTSHVFKDKNAEVVTVGKGADSADFALVNRLEPGDIAVSQDYGLAAMVLSKHGFPITQNGKIITPQNIDTLLLTRYAAKRRAKAVTDLKARQNARKSRMRRLKKN